MKPADQIEKVLMEKPAPRLVEGPHKLRLKRDLCDQMEREVLPMRKWKRNLVAVGVTAVLLLAGTVLVDRFGDTTGRARLAALDILGQAAYAMEQIRSVHIKARMRTTEGDNPFELIGLEYDFVPIEMWKRFGDPPQWRVEKPGRLVVMDGQSSLLLLGDDTRGYEAAKGGITAGFVVWLKPLMNVHQLLDSEILLAQQKGSELVLTHETGADGARKIVVHVEAQAQGDFTTSDYLKNRIIWDSDNLRIYVFDAETKLLEDLQVYVHGEEEDVLVFEITDIEYDVDIEPSLFAVAVPDDARWFLPVEELGEEYRQMQPDEVARAFFQAMADEDWDEVLKFWCISDIKDDMKRGWGGLEIISIGTPFKSGTYSGWFVPYEIKFKSGHTKKMNLAVRNDNPARRYVVDGGF